MVATLWAHAGCRGRVAFGRLPSGSCGGCIETRTHRDKPGAERGSRRGTSRSAIAAGCQWHDPPAARPTWRLSATLSCEVADERRVCSRPLRGQQSSSGRPYRWSSREQHCGQETCLSSPPGFSASPEHPRSNCKAPRSRRCPLTVPGRHSLRKVPESPPRVLLARPAEKPDNFNVLRLGPLTAAAVQNF